MHKNYLLIFVKLHTGFLYLIFLYSLVVNVNWAILVHLTNMNLKSPKGFYYKPRAPNTSTDIS
jgi:hypothetical protein